MNDFLKVSEAPQTKLRLKKAILNGSIVVYEIDINWESEYRQLENVESFLNLWDGFRYFPKNQNPEQIGWGCLGTSFYYKFKKA